VRLRLVDRQALAATRSHSLPAGAARTLLFLATGLAAHGGRTTGLRRDALRLARLRVPASDRTGALVALAARLYRAA
jgi:hypothetical protein